MNTLLQITSWLGLALTIVPSLLVFGDQIDMGTHKWLMILGLLLWFGGAGLRGRIPVEEK